MRLHILALALLSAVLSACADTQHYPLSGEDCGPDDPVKDLSADDLVIQCVGP